jgi:hypothetical protein
VLELREEREQFLVLPHLWSALLNEACFKARSFHLAMNSQGLPFLWSVRRQADETREADRWMRPALEAIRLAREKWTRIAWSEQIRTHVVAVCDLALEPEWPTLSMRDLLEVAFKNYLVTSLDHPVLKRLRGETS